MNEKFYLRFTLGEDSQLTREDDNIVVSNSRNLYHCRFSLPAEQGVVYTATFSRGRAIYAVELDENNECLIPNEVLRGSDDTRITVGLFSAISDVISASTVCEIPVIKGTSTYGATADFTPTLYQQMLKRISEVCEGIVDVDVVNELVENYLAANLPAILTETDVENIVTEYVAANRATFKGDKGDKGNTGATGKSAYELAVQNGYNGSLTQWLESLKGEKGETGAKGDTGAQGERGLQGEKGDKGDKGNTGAQGIQGVAGADGKSAYQIAVDNGFNGTEAQWLASLKGEKGEGVHLGDEITIAGTPQQTISIGNNATLNDNLGTIAIGNEALKNITHVSGDNGYFNIAIGNQAMKDSTTSDHNTAVGYQAMKGNQTGNYNTAIGEDALMSNTDGLRNVAIGCRASQTQNTGSDNTTVGSLATYSTIAGRKPSGSKNTNVGAYSGQTNGSGTGNINIGYYAGRSAENLDYTIALGYEANPTKNNQMVLGSNKIDECKIYGNTLCIRNNIDTKIRELNFNANGLVSWDEQGQPKRTFDFATQNDLNDIWKAQGELGAKNLLVYPYKSNSFNQNGITYTVQENGSILITGNNNSDAESQFTPYSLTSTPYIYLDAGKYRISLENGNYDIFMLLLIRDSLNSWNAIFISNTTNDTKEFTITDDMAAKIATGEYVVQIKICVKAHVSADNLVVYPMLRLASDTDDTWQPYVPTNKELNEKIEELIETGGEKQVTVRDTNISEYTLQPNTLYIFEKDNAFASTINIQLANYSSEIAREYHFVFSSGAGCEMTLPDFVTFMGDFEIKPNKIYEVSILASLLLYHEWDKSEGTVS